MERRRQVADALLRVVAAEGFEAASIPRIARELGASTGLVQAYFRSKDELLLFAAHQLGDRLRARVEAALARVESRDPFDRYDLLSLVQCVSRAANSPIIDLFSRCLVAYEARFRQSLALTLPASAQESYFRLIRRLLDRVPVGDASALEWAKAESSALMLEMSLRRPI